MATKFEEIGIGFQEEALSTTMAENSFAYSCNICCTKGRHSNCDKCQIAAAHARVMETLKASETAMDDEEAAVVRFQEIGISYQQSAYNLYSAERAMRSSCHSCANKEMKIDCATCKIKKFHEQIAAKFKEEMEAKQRAFEEKRKKRPAVNICSCKDL